MTKTLLALSIAALLVFPRPATGQPPQSGSSDSQFVPQVGMELWVDRNSLGGPCSDSRPRDQVTAQTPWCTFFPAVMQVQPGDVVRVRQGFYSETLDDCNSCNPNMVLQMIKSGTPGAWIRFVAQPGEHVEINGDGGGRHGILIAKTWDGIVPRFIEITGFKIRDLASDCVNVGYTSDVVLRDLEVTQCNKHSVYFGNTSAVTLENSTVHHNAITGWASAVTLHLCGDNHVIRNNAIWANTDEHPDESEGHGIIMDTCRETGGALIENNLIWDNEGWCINIFRSDGATIRNNTCWLNGNGRWGTGEVTVLGRNHSVFNNIIVTRNGRALNLRELEPEYVGHLDTLAADGNLMWSPNSEPYGDPLVQWGSLVGTVEQYRLYNEYGWGTLAISVDPLLVDGYGGDLRPTRASSAIDSGDPLHAATEDILGTPRPQDGDGDGQPVTDRGAFEYRGLDMIFLDGFDTGNPSNWTLIVN